MTSLILSFFAILFVTDDTAAALPRTISGKSVIDNREIQVGGNSKKGLVIAFLSAVCPCSDSHLIELKRLTKEFPEFEFVGIHSNTDEDKNLASSYFKAAALPFPVLRDRGTELADKFKALKTPHVFIVLNDGTLAYQGGVSSSHHFNEKTERKYLREALEDLSTGRRVRTTESRPLGCVISRGGENAW